MHRQRQQGEGHQRLEGVPLEGALLDPVDLEDGQEQGQVGEVDAGTAGGCGGTPRARPGRGRGTAAAAARGEAIRPPPARVRAGSDDAAPASVRLSCRFLAPCPGPPRLRRTSCPLESVPPARWSSRRVAARSAATARIVRQARTAPGADAGRRCRPAVLPFGRLGLALASVRSSMRRA